jgi:putative membrane protein
MKYPEPNLILASRLSKISYVLSAVVLLVVVLMRKIKFDLGVDFSFLPAVNAILNSIVSAFLLLAFYSIIRKDIRQHRLAIFAAMFFSALFLVCYVLYHITTVETSYCFDGPGKYIYYFFLITHIVLAGISLPFILLTFTKGFTYQVEAHRKMAKWVFPVWLYVAVTGPICFLMLQPCYV